jgi:organic hydroperoxide reductase OsmC/OhrA
MSEVRTMNERMKCAYGRTRDGRTDMHGPVPPTLLAATHAGCYSKTAFKIPRFESNITTRDQQV